MILRPRIVRLEGAMLKDEGISFEKRIHHDREVSLSRDVERTL
jgi:hypothetical protein